MAPVSPTLPVATTVPFSSPRETAKSGRWRKVWVWPALATLVLTVFDIGRPQLWEDELSTWSVVTRGLGSVVRTAQQADVALGPYYVLLHGWTIVFGDSATALRMPSALAMVGAACGTALCAERLFGRRAGVSGGLLFASIPLVTRYGQEARPYALVMCATVWASWFLLRALEKPGRPLRWVHYGLAVTAVGLFHMVALTSLLGHSVLVAIRWRSDKRQALGFGCAVLAALGCLAPLALAGNNQATQNIGWVPRPDAWGLLSLGPQLFASGMLFGSAALLAVAAWGHPPVALPRDRDRGATTPRPAGDDRQPQGGHTSWGAWRERVLLWAGRYEAVLFATSSAILPVLAVWALSHGHHSYFFFRYMLFTLPAWAMLAGAGIAMLRSRAMTAAVLAVVALMGVADQRSIRGVYTHFWTAEDYRGAAMTIQKSYRPADAVVYGRGADAWHQYDLGVAYYLPRHLHMRDVFLDKSAAVRNMLAPTECARAASCLGAEQRIWLVTTGWPADPISGLRSDQAQVLRGRYRVIQIERLTGLTVALLQR